MTQSTRPASFLAAAGACNLMASHRQIKNPTWHRHNIMTRPTLDRRNFLRGSLAASAALTLGNCPLAAALADDPKTTKEPLFKISLAEWSLHKALFGKTARQPRLPQDRQGASSASTPSSTSTSSSRTRPRTTTYLADLKKRADDLGVTSVLIMIDGEGDLGDPDEAKRTQAVENHNKWVEAAKSLGCHAIRVNAHSDGSYDEQPKLAADGLRRLAEFGAKHEHQRDRREPRRPSSERPVARRRDQGGRTEPNCGTLPDFGNFPGRTYDRYKGVDRDDALRQGRSAPRATTSTPRATRRKTDYRQDDEDRRSTPATTATSASSTKGAAQRAGGHQGHQAAAGESPRRVGQGLMHDARLGALQTAAGQGVSRDHRGLGCRCFRVAAANWCKRERCLFPHCAAHGRGHRTHGRGVSCGARVGHRLGARSSGAAAGAVWHC